MKKKVRLPTAVIRPMTASMLSSVVACHRLGFAGYLNNRLGTKYLYAFFRWFSETEDAIALCAVVNTDIVGYVVGAPLGYRTSLNRRVRYAALSSIVLRPHLVLDKRFIQRAITKFQELRGNVTLDDAPELPTLTYSLVGIATHPHYQGRGIATNLIQEFEKLALASNARSLRLSVYRENDSARNLYSRSGWSHYPRDGGLADYYYKILAAA